MIGPYFAPISPRRWRAGRLAAGSAARLAAGCALLCAALAAPPLRVARAEHRAATAEETQGSRPPGGTSGAASQGRLPPGGVYACPMHPDVTSPAPGACPRCNMALVAMDPFDAREYLVDAEAVPRAVRAGEPFRLQLTVRDPGSHATVGDFATVHDKRFHLFVIGQDLEHYAHVHPDQQPDGSWAIDLTLPRPGYYKLYSDFLPMGGTPQVVAAPFVTTGFRGDLSSSAARLVPDREWTKAAGSMRVALELPESGLVAGREEMFAFHLTDQRTGAPVADVEPYLAAWGHTLLVSQDTQSVVHAHPVELVPADDPSARGGPTVTFKALFPKAGPYRLWTQMQRQGVIITAMFTVDVASPVAP